MGEISVKFQAKRRQRTITGNAVVDSGAQTSVLGLADACRLGLNVAKAPRVDRLTAGGLTLTGLQLTAVQVEANGRRATLHDVFVPVAQVLRTRGKVITTPVAQNEPTLLGQDFLQASKSLLDFETDTLRGIETLGPPVSLSRKFTVRPASKNSRELIRALAVCPRKKR